MVSFVYHIQRPVAWILAAYLLVDRYWRVWRKESVASRRAFENYQNYTAAMNNALNQKSYNSIQGE